MDGELIPARSRLAPVVVLVVLVVVLAGLALVTGGGGGAASDTPHAAEEAPAEQEAATIRNDDGTVGPVVALGDSLTSDGSIAGERTFASWYAAALAAEPRLIDAGNAGIGGETTEFMLARFDRDVAVHGPRVVVILGGTNDLARGRTPAEILGTLEEIADRVRGIGAVPVLGTIPPLGAYGSRVAGVEELDAAIRGYGEATRTTVIEFFPAVAGEQGDWRPEFTVDGVHPTPAGAEAMAEVAVATLLGK